MVGVVHYLVGSVCLCYLGVFFYKQKTAYELRISDWSSDVCSSDLKMAERDKLKRLLMRGLKHDQRREAGLPRLFPARGAQAPAVALMQPAKAIFGAGGGQVVADGAGELQELVRDEDRKSTRLNSSH